MAFTADEYGRSKGAPGLPFGNWKNSETGIMQEAADLEGGFPLFGKKASGEGDKVYVTKPSSKGYFKGVAERATSKDSYSVGDDISVIKEGEVWVVAGENVVAGDGVAVNASNEFVKTSNTLTECVGTFKTDASKGDLVVIDVKF